MAVQDFTGDSFNLVSSGISKILTGLGRRYRILVIGDFSLSDIYDGSFPYGYLSRFNPPGGIAGLSCSGFSITPPLSGSPVNPFITLDSEPTNLSKTPWQEVWDPIGDSYGYFWDTGAGGSSLPYCTISGGHEYQFDPLLAVANDAEILTCTLNSSPCLASPLWYQRALTLRSIFYAPDLTPAGTSPITGGPSLKLGVRRGASPFTLGSASPFTTTRSLQSLSGTLTAGSGLPALSLNNAVGATNLGSRFMPTLFQIENDAPEGLSLVFLNNPAMSSNGWSNINDPTLDVPFLEQLPSHTGPFDLVIWHCGQSLWGTEDVETGFWVNELDELTTGVNQTTSESHSDGVNTLKSTFGTTGLLTDPLPILFISHHYCGHGTTDDQRALIRTTLNSAMFRNCTPQELEQDGSPGNHLLGLGRFSHSHCAFINLYTGFGTVPQCDSLSPQLCITPPTDYRPTPTGSLYFLEAIDSIIKRASQSGSSLIRPRSHPTARRRQSR